jgi:hypothetical protein
MDAAGARVVALAHTMVSHAQLREIALGLPEAVEADHHGRPSFRVAGKIFATLWDADYVNVMLDEGGVLTAVQADPDACAEFWWGKRLRAVSIDLRRARGKTVAALLEEAWERKAPRRTAR